MKVYVVTYYVEEGEAGINSVWKNKKDAQRRFEACVRYTFEGDDVEPSVIRAAVKKALKTGRHDYSGSGCGHDNPWYQAEFLKERGAACPACRSTNVSAGHPECDGNVWMPVECEDCGARWTELHKLDGYADLTLASDAR